MVGVGGCAACGEAQVVAGHDAVNVTAADAPGCHTLYQTKEGGNYTVKDPEKLKRIAGEWGIATEGKDIYDLAHEVAETALMEYGPPRRTYSEGSGS